MKKPTARKRFGQNFLQDQSVIRTIVDGVRPQSDDIVIEIGPGLGALTGPLCAQINRLHVIEIDRDIIDYLKKQDFALKLDIHSGDVLRFDFSSVIGKKKIVGNLPYNISTPLLFHLINFVDEIIDMHFMLQKEVVQRICAPTGSLYGRLSVMMQYFFDCQLLCEVPPHAFIPAPKVDSAVIRMIPDVGRAGVAHNFDAFSRLVAQAFSMRRKTLRNNLKNIASDEDLISIGLETSVRPEEVPVEYFVALSNFLYEKQKNQG